MPAGLTINMSTLLLKTILSKKINPFMANRLTHCYRLGESTFILRGIRSDFEFSYKFFMKILSANRIASDGTLRSTASHPGLYCLPMPHKRMPGLNELMC